LHCAIIMADEARRAQIDNLLFAVTQQQDGGIHGLLDAMFSFLARRTDFYYESSPGDKMGFPPDMAQSMVSDISINQKQVG
jgi:hypothetical protein